MYLYLLVEAFFFWEMDQTKLPSIMEVNTWVKYFGKLGRFFLVRGKYSNWEGRLSAIFYFCWQTIVHSHDIGRFFSIENDFFFLSWKRLKLSMAFPLLYLALSLSLQTSSIKVVLKDSYFTLMLLLLVYRNKKFIVVSVIQCFSFLCLFFVFSRSRKHW